MLAETRDIEVRDYRNIVFFILVEFRTRDTTFGHTKTRVFIFYFDQGVTSHPDEKFRKTKDDDKYIILVTGGE